MTAQPAEGVTPDPDPVTAEAGRGAVISPAYRECDVGIELDA
jgi:hypothetical protein